MSEFVNILYINKQLSSPNLALNHVGVMGHLLSNSEWCIKGLVPFFKSQINFELDE